MSRFVTQSRLRASEHSETFYAHGLVDCILQRLGSASDGNDLCAEHLHPGDVERLPSHVLGAHVDDALKAELGANRRGSDSMLASSCLCDNTRLSDPASKQDLDATDEEAL